VFNTAWTGAPRWVYVPAVYLGVGWVAVPLPQLRRGAGLTALVLIVAGGVLYSLGGIAYGLRRPAPSRHSPASTSPSGLWSATPRELHGARRDGVMGAVEVTAPIEVDPGCC
jgi:predicted membrane channel-forming protein YqfA (hemolysin III family)